MKGARRRGVLPDGNLRLSEFARRMGLSRYKAETFLYAGKVPGAYRNAAGWVVPKDAAILRPRFRQGKG